MVIEWRFGYLSEDEGKPTALAKGLPGSNDQQRSASGFLSTKVDPFNHDIYDNLEEEKKIIANKKVMRNACLLQYDIDLSAIQLYSGGK